MTRRCLGDFDCILNPRCFLITGDPTQTRVGQRHLAENRLQLAKVQARSIGDPIHLAVISLADGPIGILPEIVHDLVRVFLDQGDVGDKSIYDRR